MDIELDDEDGKLVYEVEFKSGSMEYDYEIDAVSGAVLKHEAELDDWSCASAAGPMNGLAADARKKRINTNL